MNHDEKSSDMQTWIEPELEARVVAWVSGEASAFEIAELERLTREKPELGLFKRRIEAVRGLVADAVRPEQAPLRLAPERRKKLLETLGGGDAAAEPPSAPVGPVSPPANTHAVYPAPARKRRPGHPAWLLGLAACACFGLFAWVTLPSMISRKAAEPAFAVSLKPESPPNSPENDAYQPPALRDIEEKRSMARSAERAAIARQKAESDKLASRNFKRREPQESSAMPAPPSSVPLEFPSLRDSEQSSSRTYDRQLAARPGAKANKLQSSLEKKDQATFGYEGGQSFSASYIPAAPGARTKISMPAAQQSFAAARGVAGVLAATAQPQQTWAARPIEAGIQGGVTLGVADGQLQTQGLDAKGRLTQANVLEQVQLSPFTVSAKEEPVVTGDMNAEAESPAPSADADRPAERRPEPVATTDEVSAAKEAVSTFSLHVSDVSFRLAQAALARGELPDPASVRPEEFYNAFNYGDPAPAMAERISCHIEQAAHPSLQQRNLVRLAMKVPAVGRSAQQPLHLTVLLDTSGSMEREDRAASVRSALGVLVSLLGPADRLTLIGFARQPRLLAEQVPGDQANSVLEQIARTPSEGGTNLEEALKLAAELAQRGYDAAAQNRIVLLTDGAANLGNANPSALAARVESVRQQGIAFDACGVGLDGMDDTVLEALTRKGDGRYYVLDSPEAADAGFARQLAGAFRPAAENVKVQVRFNPARVGRYRLIGFEQHRLNEEDFRNDKVEAAELAAEEAAVALYQVEVLPQGEGEIGEVYVRFRDASNGNMVERSWTIHYDPDARPFDQASASLQLAGVSALLAENLRGGPAGNAARLGDLAGAVNRLRTAYTHEPRVQELATMYQQLRRLRGE